MSLLVVELSPDRCSGDLDGFNRIRRSLVRFCVWFGLVRSSWSSVVQINLVYVVSGSAYFGLSHRVWFEQVHLMTFSDPGLLQLDLCGPNE